MQGTVRRWDADKGFGFIQAAHSSNVFFHVRDYRGNTPPVVGMEVEYKEIQVGGKGPRAMQVRPRSAPSLVAPRSPHPPPGSKSTSPRRAQHSAPAGASWAMALMLAWVALLAWGGWTQRLPLGLLGILAVLNGVTFVTYAVDKSAAQRGAWRTSEKTLHLLALLGGWPAAWWAQQWMRHKSSKASFRMVYWCTVLLHSAALGAIVWQPGWLPFSGFH